MAKPLYKPQHDPANPKQMRKRLSSLSPEDRKAVEDEAKKLVNIMHNNGARMFGKVSALELLEKLYKFNKAVELDLPPDLRKTRTLIGLAESAEDV